MFGAQANPLFSMSGSLRGSPEDLVRIDFDFSFPGSHFKIWITAALTGTRLVRVRVQRMVRAFQANIVDAYGDEQLLRLELYLTRFGKVPRKRIVSFEHAASQVSFQSGTVGATHIHAPIPFQTPPDKKHQARAVLTRSRQ